MHLLKNLGFTLILIISCSFFAQVTAEPKATRDWHIREVLYLDETHGLGIVEHTVLNNSLVLINNMAQVVWTVPLNEFIWGISKFKGNILVCYKKSDEVHLATLDINSRKIINDKIVYEGSKLHFAKVQNDKAGNFDNLLVRVFASKSDMEETKALSLITLAEDGSAIVKEVPSVAIGASYIGCSTTEGGHVSVASIVNNAVVVEQFNHNAVLENKLESPLNSRKKFNYDAQMRTDSFASNTVVISLKYENPDKEDIFSYFSFNFDNKKITVADEVPVKDNPLYKFKNRKELKPVNISFSKEKIIVVKEVSYFTVPPSQSLATLYSTEETAVVSVYDRKMHLLHDIVLEKFIKTFGSIHIGLECHVHNDKLHVLSTESEGFGTFQYNCYTIDLNSGKWEKKPIGKLYGSRTLDTKGTLWFNNELIIGYMSTSGNSFTTVLEKLSYNDL